MQPNQTFFQKNKKEIIIASVALIILILVGYFLFLNKKETESMSGEAELKSNSTFFNNLFSNVSEIFDGNGNENVTEEDATTEDFYIEGLIKIWKEPVAGYGIGEEFFYQTIENENGDVVKEKYKKNILYFVDSKTGYVYKKDLWQATSSPIQITSSSFPNTVRAYFLNDKDGITSRVILQYLDDNVIKTVSANVPDYFGAPGRLLNTAVMPDNITNITISPDAQKAFYIVKKSRNTNGKTDYYTDWYLINNESETFGKRMYTSENTAWKGILTDKKDIFTYQTSTAFEKSNLYKLNTDSTLSLVYTGRTGNSFLINDNSILVSMFTASGLRTFLNQSFNKEALQESGLLNLGFNTLAEKCSSVPTLTICGVPREIKNYDSGLPDAWYQGLTTWNDRLYVVNDEYPFGELLFDFKVDGEVYDTIDSRDLKINSLLTHLMFINKNDGSLWGLNINNILLPEEVIEY